MNWKEARQRISQCLNENPNLTIDNPTSPYAIYQEPWGFELRLNGESEIQIKWSVLEHFWREVNHNNKFDINTYRAVFGNGEDADQIVTNIIKQIFLSSGLLKESASPSIKT